MKLTLRQVALVVAMAFCGLSSVASPDPISPEQQQEILEKVNATTGRGADYTPWVRKIQNDVQATAILIVLEAGLLSPEDCQKLLEFENYQQVDALRLLLQSEKRRPYTFMYLSDVLQIKNDIHYQAFKVILDYGKLKPDDPILAMATYFNRDFQVDLLEALLDQKKDPTRYMEAFFKTANKTHEQAFLLLAYNNVFSPKYIDEIFKFTNRRQLNALESVVFSGRTRLGYFFPRILRIETQNQADEFHEFLGFNELNRPDLPDDEEKDSDEDGDEKPSNNNCRDTFNDPE